MVGEVIEKLSGKSYREYIKEKILDPLGLSHTTADHSCTHIDKRAKLCAALDDTSACRLPFPKVQDGNIVVAAQGIFSNVNELLIYSVALSQALQSELKSGKSASSLLEKSYAFGFYRNQLPGSLEGLGCNSMFVKQMPVLKSGGEHWLILSDGESLAGYTASLTMVPEMDASVVILTNSIGLADSTDWINQLLIEALIDTPELTGFVKLAKEAAKTHVDRVPRLAKRLEETHNKSTSAKQLEEYIGLYHDPARDWMIHVKLNDDNVLQVAFPGLESQIWDLQYYEDDTFLRLTPRTNKQREHGLPFLVAQSNKDGVIKKLCWPHEPSVPVEE